MRRGDGLQQVSHLAMPCLAVGGVPHIADDGLGFSEGAEQRDGIVLKPKGPQLQTGHCFSVKCLGFNVCWGNSCNVSQL